MNATDSTINRGIFMVIVTGLGLGSTWLYTELLAPEEHEPTPARVVRPRPRTPSWAGGIALDAPALDELATAPAVQTREPLLSSVVDTRRIAGRIERAADGTPIEEDVIVRPTGRRRGYGGPPDAGGPGGCRRAVVGSSFDLPGIPANAAFLTLTRTRCNADGKEVVIGHQSVALPPGDQDVEGLIIRLETGDTLNGVVVDPNDQPVAGAYVLVEGHTATTAADGTFVVRDVAAQPARRLVWVVRHADHPPLEIRLVKTTATSLLRLAWGGRVAGRIIDRDGRPIAGATIELTPYSSHSRIPAELMPHDETSGEGTFVLTGIPAHSGNHVIVRASGHATGQFGLGVVEAGRTTFLDIELGPGATVGGMVTDDRGRAMAGVGLTLTGIHWPSAPGPSFPSPSWGLALGTAVTGSDGRYAFEAVAGQLLSLSVHRVPPSFSIPISMVVRDVGHGDRVEVETLTLAAGNRARRR